MKHTASRILGRLLRASGLLLAGIGICLGCLAIRRMNFADQVRDDHIVWAQNKSKDEQTIIIANLDTECSQLLCATLAAFLTGTTLLGFGWSIGRRSNQVIDSRRTSATGQAAAALACLLFCCLTSCGNGASAAEAPSSPSGLLRLLDDAREKAIARLKGRWQRALLEDVVFGDDGTLLVDGPGSFDLTGSYDVRDSKRVTINWGVGPDFDYKMSFIGDQLRLTLTDSSIGDGWTLTRRR